MADPLNATSQGLLAGIWVPVSLSDLMRFHVQSQVPLEACGLVGGQKSRALGVFPVLNALRSAVRYRMDAEEQVRAFLDLEQRGWDLLAIYHSHPNGPGQPSPTDLAEAAYAEAVHLIWSPQEGTACPAPTWQCRGFLLKDDTFIEVPIWNVEE